MYHSAFETVAVREAAGIIWVIIEINCEHALSRFEIRGQPCDSKKPAVENGGGAVVIKEFSLEKRSPETRSMEREVGMRSNEWLLLGVLNDW